MLLITFLGLIAKLTLVSGECDVGTQNMDDFDYTKVGVIDRNYEIYFVSINENSV